MAEGNEATMPPPAALTDAELRALAYFAVGIGSEGGNSGRDVFHRLSFAGNIRNGVMDPVGNSGYSIGTLQTDLGQHPEVAASLVGAYQTWARAAHPDWVLSDAQQTQTVSDLGRNGRTIEAQNGRPLDATIKSHLDSFLASDAGITYVHDRDVAQVDLLMRPGSGVNQLRETALYQNATLDDQARLSTIVLKLENQGGGRYFPRIIDGINNGTIGSVEDAQTTVNGFLPNRGGRSRTEPDYVETGVTHALEATEVLNGLRNADPLSPLHQPWQNVLADPLINPTLTDQDTDKPDLSSEYTAVKGLFLQKAKAPALVAALDQGAAYGYNITDRQGPSRPQSTSLYASGDDFVVMDGNGIGKAYVGGTWSDVDRASLTRVNNRDGTVDLNINRDGVVERLLRVDPNAPVLRPSRPAVDPPEAVPPQQQGWGPFTPSLVPAAAPVLVPPGVKGGQNGDTSARQRAIDEDRPPNNSIPASGSIDPATFAAPPVVGPYLTPERGVSVQDGTGKAMLEQAMKALSNSPNLWEGSLSEADKERVAMGLARSALEAQPPLSRIDHVVVGRGETPNVFAVQGDLRDPAHLRTHLPMSEALQTNMEQGISQLNQLALQRQQEQEQEQQRQLQLDTQQGHPVMRMGGL